jgi:hypothetical protein
MYRSGYRNISEVLCYRYAVSPLVTEIPLDGSQVSCLHRQSSRERLQLKVYTWKSRVRAARLRQELDVRITKAAS